MTESVYVNSDRSKIVEEGSPDAAYRIHLKDAKRLGLVADRPKGTKIVEEPKAKSNGTPHTRRSPEKRDQ